MMSNKLVATAALSIVFSAGVSYLMVTEMRPKADAAVYRIPGIESSMTATREALDTANVANLKNAKNFDAHIRLIAAQLALSGIVDDKDDPVQRWWCWAARCERTEEDCKLSISMMQLQALRTGKSTLAENLTSVKCERSRLAFCSLDECYGTLEVCGKAAEKPKLCRGVE